jgi:protein-tyrosine-phosphatase
MSERRLSVLFLCTGNRARSQMAEAILRHVSSGRIDVASAGTHPKSDVHPMAREAVKRLLNVDMSGQFPKSVDRFVNQQFDYVITVCDDAAEACPVFPGATERLHWSYPDPVVFSGTDEQQQQAFDELARQMMGRMRAWLSSISRSPT